MDDSPGAAARAAGADARAEDAALTSTDLAKWAGKV